MDLATSEPTGASLRSLAVLPFANLSGDTELDHLAEAISSGLITTLREFDGLQIVGRSESGNRPDTSRRFACSANSASVRW